MNIDKPWRVGRADEGTSLENWHILTDIVGSNPTPSAIFDFYGVMI